jgi:hypothetical protein
MYNNSYTLLQIAWFEVEHGILSSLVALQVSLPVLCWMSITFRNGYSASGSASCPSASRSGYTKAVISMVLLSFSAGLVAHVLEDVWVGWF